MKGMSSMTKNLEVVENSEDLVEMGLQGAESLSRLRDAKSSAFIPSRTVREQKTKLAQMRQLRNILGDSVLEVIPAAIREAVDDSYKFWLENPDSYLPTQFDTEQERDDALCVMRAYAEMANDDGYTIRTLGDEDPTILIWRAQTRRVIKNRG